MIEVSIGIKRVTYRRLLGTVKNPCEIFKIKFLSVKKIYNFFSIVKGHEGVFIYQLHHLHSKMIEVLL